MTDTSVHELGSILAQFERVDKWALVHFTSLVLKYRELNSAAKKQGCFVIAHCLQKWLHFLGDDLFTCATGHFPLE